MKTMEKRMPWRRTAIAAALALAATAVTPAALAQQGNSAMKGQTQTEQTAPDVNNDYGYGPGMMDGYGYGPGMRGGYGYGPGMRGGYGYGPRMMRGYGPGMMGGYGYGPGMMGGYGYGPGMMGGYGPGMMWGYGYGPGGLASLGLSAEQQHKIDQMYEEHFQKQQKLRAQLYDDAIKIREEMSRDNPNTKALGKTYDRIAQVRKEMFLNRVEMAKQLNNVLTEKQRKELQDRWNWQAGPEQGGE